MLSKSAVHQKVLAVLEKRIQENSRDIEEIRSSLTSDTKSSAGDKHETSRAHLQIEMEQISNQLSILLKHRQSLLQIDESITSTKIEQGSLVETSIGTFYFSTSMGRITVDGEDVFCLSLNAPMGQQLLGKKMGDKIHFNSKSILVEELI